MGLWHYILGLDVGGGGGGGGVGGFRVDGCKVLAAGCTSHGLVQFSDDSVHS